MLLKDAQVGQVCVVEEIHLPFQLERRLERKMEELLKRYDAPDCQYERTGLGRQRED